MDLEADKKLTVKAYTQLLEKAYSKIQVKDDPKVIRFTRLIYLSGIIICFVLASNFPPYREVLGAAILLLGIFLLNASIRSNIKKRRQKNIRKTFDHMLYQISEVTHLIFDWKGNQLEIRLIKKDDSQRLLFFDLDQLSAYQWLEGSFLIGNEEGIDFIIPEGIFSSPDYQEMSNLIKSKLEKSAG